MSWILLATVSALLSAAAAIAQKRVLARVSALEFSFLVSLVVLALSLAVPFTTDVLAFDTRTLALLWGKSVLGGIAFLLVMTALERNAISEALPLLGLTPAVTALLAMLVLGEWLGVGQWLGLLLMLAGIWALEARTGAGMLSGLRRTLLGGRHRAVLGAIALFAVSSVADKLLVSGMSVPPFVVMFHQHLVYALVFALLLLIRRHSWATLPHDARAHLPMLLAIAALTVGYRFFQLEATRAGPVALVLAVKRTSILYATLFGGRMFAEEKLATRLVGAALIVAAGFLFLGSQ